MEPLTPSQARFIQEAKERRLRFAASVKAAQPVICISAAVLAEPEPAPTVQQWADRQVRLYGEPWFSIVEEVEPPIPSMLSIQRICATYYAISMTELLSERRVLKLVRARQVAMFLCKEFTLRSMPEIGRRFGGKDHTTVLHAFRKIEAKEKYDNDLAEELKFLRERIRAAA